MLTQPDQSVHEVTTLLEEGRDLEVLTAIQRLASRTDDPALRRELLELAAEGQASARAIRKAWDRLQIATMVGR